MHYSVMLKEAIDALNLQEEGTYVDATLGYAGHSGEILTRVKRGFLFAFDQDINAINYSFEKLNKIGSNFKIIKSNFLYMKEQLEQLGVFKVNGILFDLGVSSPQLDEKNRGFSYLKEARLDMRMDLDSDFSAYDVVNTYSEDDLARIIFTYGEEKYAKSIAKNIVQERTKKPIETTFQLVDIVRRSMPVKKTIDKNPARKTFQAIRIEVNHEIEILEESLRKALDLLDINGRLVVITFHSLEDRITKKLFKEMTELDPLVKGLPDIPDSYKPKFRLVNSKVITPGDAELKENSRSRSSKLRVIERIR